MTPIIFDTICASYEKSIDQLEVTIVMLRHDLADERDLLTKANAKIDELKEIADRQKDRLQAVREKAAAVRDGCIDWERGAMQMFIE